MQNTFIAAALLLSVAQSTMLSAQLTISPKNQTGNAACPGTVITYTISGLPSNCEPIIEVTADSYESFNRTEKNKVEISLKDISQTATITVRPPSGSGSCPAQHDFPIPVLSVKNSKPFASNCPGH